MHSKTKLTTYLVGGAVRDELLGIQSLDRDWVVVGSSITEMLTLGYKQVGKSFPVFLHPTTKEEYALARTEHKQGRGYKGFICDFSASVSITEDLKRRDLTINAIAKDQHGQLVDPFNGAEDIKNKILRHVSAAFIEDPLRILRVARFQARFFHLGFTIADSTMVLLKQMVANNELIELTVERVWQEINLALQTNSPWMFFEVLQECGALQIIFPSLSNLQGVPQPEKYHPEIDSFIHTMLTLKQASLLSLKPEVRFAALCHDLGKGLTPKHILPQHIGHEARGVPLIKAWCTQYKVPNEYRDLSMLVSQWHLMCHRVQELRANTLLKLIKNLDAIRKPERFKDFVLVCCADARGALGSETIDYPQQYFLLQAAQIIKNIKLEIKPEQTAEAIKRAVWDLQVKALKKWLHK